MAGIGDKVVMAGQFVDHWSKQLIGKLIGTIAAPADGVMMGAMGLQRKLDGSRAHIGLDDQVEPAQQIECAVDGRQVDITIDPLDDREDILRGDVPRHLLDGFEDDRPLWRHSHATALEFFD